MSDHEKLIQLANALVARDESQECQFCGKNEWGEDKHAPSCPFAIAYAILHEEENKQS